MHILEKYYKIHSKIYDLTRWTFLFGRNELALLIGEKAAPKKILEVGCGTGYNLLKVARLFPDAELTGLDLSADMLHVAERKLSCLGVRATLLQRPYDACLNGNFDLLLFSYSLSMMGDAWESVIKAAHGDLSKGGLIGIIDFYDSPSPLFNKWLEINHVGIRKAPEEYLGRFFTPLAMSIRKAYLGLWSYYIYLGRHKEYLL